MFMLRIQFLLISVLALCPGVFADQVKFRNGDIIFQETRSNQAEAIKRATGSPYSHVGIIYFQKEKAYVFEAVQPVKLTPLPDFIRHGVKRKYVVKRLKNASAAITPTAAQAMYPAGKKHVGKNYDWVFGWSDEKIYCSELVWKIYKDALGIELAPPKKLKDFNLADKIVQKKLSERYGKKIPYEEPVVSPGQLFDSPLLETVYGD
jgi:uncharacterized protein YycO